jgi:hypothetical protein
VRTCESASQRGFHPAWTNRLKAGCEERVSSVVKNRITATYGDKDAQTSRLLPPRVLFPSARVSARWSRRRSSNDGNAQTPTHVGDVASEPWQEENQVEEDDLRSGERGQRRYSKLLG